MLPEKRKGDSRPTIMIVDDTPANLALLQDMLHMENYRVLAFPQGALALKAAEKSPPDIILLDIVMPEMDGFEVCRRLKADEKLKDIPVLFISALSDNIDKGRAFEAGGIDYIIKPFQFEEVHARVGAQLRLAMAKRELQHHNETLEEKVREKVAELKAAQMAIIDAVSSLAEIRDSDTNEHIGRTKRICTILMENLRRTPKYAQLIDEKFIEKVAAAAPLHDIGKVAIPDAILLKPAKLTPEEFEIMKTHSAIGADALKAALARDGQNDFIATGMNIARYHHERWDGNGYPDGLSGEDIPLAARIMAIADVYDALRSRRPYKAPFSHEESIRIIQQGSGAHFDPNLVEAFMEEASALTPLHQGE
jgi:putative two-component system response regulator